VRVCAGVVPVEATNDPTGADREKTCSRVRKSPRQIRNAESALPAVLESKVGSVSNFGFADFCVARTSFTRTSYTNQLLCGF
jgi:hypothetical protein